MIQNYYKGMTQGCSYFSVNRQCPLSRFLTTFGLELDLSENGMKKGTWIPE